MKTAEILTHLELLASAENRAGMARFGIVTGKAFGVPNAILRPLARRIGRDHDRALELWDTGWREARLLACFTDDPKHVTAAQAHRWADDFNSWEIVDHAADLFVDAGLIDHLAPEFAADEREFVRRTAFAMIAWAAVHLKKRPDDAILTFLPLIEHHASDPRNFVKKAVDWALRQTGKRSRYCHARSLALANNLSASPDRTRRWIGKRAAKELTSKKVLQKIGIN